MTPSLGRICSQSCGLGIQTAQGTDAQGGLHSSDGLSRDDWGSEAWGPSCVQRVASWVLLCSCQDLCFLVRPSHVAPWSRGARLLGEQPGALQAQEQKPPGWPQAGLRNAQHPSSCGLLREAVTAEAAGRRACAGPGPRVQGGEVPWELSQEPTATAKSRAAVSRGPHLSPPGLPWQDAHPLCPGVSHPPRGPREPGGESGLCISC